MKRNIKIGETEVPMVAMASVNTYYRQIFGEDPLKVIMGEDSDGADLTNAYMQMGFVMAKFSEFGAKRKLMMQLNQDDYAEWLDQFSNGDMMEALPEIRSLWMGEKNTESTEKNG